jgi:hypothetical protein
MISKPKFTLCCQFHATLSCHTYQNSAQPVVDFSKGKLSFIKKKIISFVATQKTWDQPKKLRLKIRRKLGQP